MIPEAQILRAIAAILLLLAGSCAYPGSVSAQETTLASPMVVAWRFRSPHATNLPLAGSGELIYTALSGGEIAALSKTTGAQIWRNELGGEISAAPLTGGTEIYVATRKSSGNLNTDTAARTGALRALSAAGGLTKWVTDIPAPLIGLLSDSATRVFGVDGRGALTSFDKTNGNIEWEIQRKSKFTTNIVVNDQRLYIGSGDGVVHAFEQATGKIAWQRKPSLSAMITTLASDGRRLFVGSADGRVYALDAGTGNPLWQKRFRGTVKFVVASNAGVIIALLNNTVYCVEPQRGKRVWKRQLTGRLAASPVIMDKAVLVAPLSGDACLVLHIENGKVINSIPVDESIDSVVQPLLIGATLVLATNNGLIAYTASSAPTR